jgi:peptidoglycan-associated lipoprotein
MNSRKILYVGILFIALVLSACSSKKADEAEMLPEQDPTAIGREESLESKSIGIMEGRTSGPMLPVYFGYDSYTIRGDQSPRMKVNADYLKDEEQVKIRIEGNCDPRGTREYNLALGEKRALGAKKYLINMGIASARITTVSLGEEKILLHGHDEMSWAQNRRDDFVVE